MTASTPWRPPPPATINTEVDALAFTPTAGAPGTSSTTAFALSDLSSAYATPTVNTTTTVIDTDPAAAPTISGTVAAQPTTSEALVHPFSAVTITDPNSGATDTLTITLSGAGGTLSGTGLINDGDGVYTLAAPPAATITTEVDALAFTPTAGAPGTSSTTAFALSDLSSAYATATVNTTTTVIDTDPAAAPTISGTVAGQPTTSEALVHPFSAVTITDPNSGATDTLTITLSGAGGTLSGTGLINDGDGVYTLAAAAPATINTEVDALAFTPTAGAPGTSSTTAFALSDLSSAYATPTVNTTTTVIDTDPAAAPTISGTVAAQPTTSEALVHPFSAVTITDPNSGATDTLTITLSGAGGTLSGTGLINDGDGVYTLAAAAPATINTEVDALAFTPTAGAPGTSSTTAFALSDLSSAYATPTVNTTTTVIDTDPAAAPTISGTVAAQPTTSEALVHPFSAVTITDPNSGATDTLTITLSGAGGTLSGTGLINDGDGVYTLAAAAPATINTEVDALAFTPTAGAPGTSSTTAFALSDLSSAYATPTVNTTTTVIDTDPAAAPTISLAPIDGTDVINAAEAAAGVTISGTESGANGQTVTVTITNTATDTVVDTLTTTAEAGAWSTALTSAQAEALANGSYTFSAGVSDSSGNAATPATQTVTVDTTTVSETVPSSLSGNENTTISLSGITVSATPNTGDTLTTVLSVSHGTITVGTPGDVTTVGNNGSASVTLTGTAAEIDAALATTTYLGGTNYYGTDSLVVTTTDATSGNTSGPSTVPITIAAGTEHWVGTSSADWATVSASDWNFVSPPTTGNPAVIDTSGTYTVTISSADVAQSLVINDAGATVLDETGGSLTLGGALTIDAGLFEFAGGTLAGVSALTIGAGGVIDAANPDSAVVIDTGNPVVNEGILEVSNGGDLVIQDPLNNEGGIVSIQDGIVELDITNGLIADFSGSGGTLQLDGTVTGGAASGVDATFTGTADMTISVGPDVTITSAALYGIGAVSAGSGVLSVSMATGDMVDTVDSGGEGSAGIVVVDQATAIAASADSSITVTANGTIKSGTAEITTGGGDGEPAGILAGYEGGTSDTANAAVFGNVTVTNNANITAQAGDGIRAFTFGTGNVAVNDDSGTITTDGEPLSGQTSPIEGFGNGIYALNDGVGNITVSMASGATITSAASGIFASNTATSVPSTSSISVVAGGTIDSGAILAPGGSRPAGILAGYNSNSEPESNVAGNVFVTNDANITAAAGDGIRAYNYGTGNVTVTDEANTQIQTTGTNGQYGIEAFSDNGTGNISISTSTGDVITSASTGIQAVNEATTIPAADDSTITVTAHGTIDSGSTLNISGSEPGRDPGRLQSGWHRQTPIPMSTAPSRSTISRTSRRRLGGASMPTITATATSR